MSAGVQHPHDKLFRTVFADTEEAASFLRFRLLKYMCRIWDESFKQHPEQSELAPILPVVFYQGTSEWRYSTEFADLFPAGERSTIFCPALPTT